MSSYSDRLKDPRWQRRRLEILEAYDWECKDCFTKNATLHVHHLYYERNKDPWDYPDWALAALCDKCHKKRHPAEIAFDMYIRAQADTDTINELLDATRDYEFDPDTFLSTATMLEKDDYLACLVGRSCIADHFENGEGI